jgi:hypothetical protein
VLKSGLGIVCTAFVVGHGSVFLTHQRLQLRCRVVDVLILGLNNIDHNGETHDHQGLATLVDEIDCIIETSNSSSMLLRIRVNVDVIVSQIQRCHRSRSQTAEQVKSSRVLWCAVLRNQKKFASWPWFENLGACLTGETL